MIDLYGAAKMAGVIMLVLLMSWGVKEVKRSRARGMEAGQPIDTTWHDMGRGVRWKIMPLDSLGWDCVVVQAGGTANIECMRQFR